MSTADRQGTSESSADKPDPHKPEAHKPGAPYTLNEVLAEELNELRPRDFEGLTGRPYDNPDEPDLDEVPRAEDLRRIYLRIAALENGKRLSALCLSGGGIRSATFNLGVIQGLARLGLLDQFDYLSTVSGGGYIGGWLKAWMHRRGTQAVINELSNTMPDQPLKPEPRPVDRLREYSNFLTPRRGLVSGDTWAAIALIVRNLLLNWLVVVPVLLAAVAVPQVYAMALRLSNDTVDGILPRATWAIGIASALAIVASFVIHRARGRKPPEAKGHARLAFAGVAALLLASGALALGAAWLPSPRLAFLPLLIFAALWCILIPALGWAANEPFRLLDDERRWPWQELVAMLVSGLVTFGLFVLLASSMYPRLVARPILYTTFAVPLLIALYLVSRTLFVALTDFLTQKLQIRGIVAREDADREWWARLSGHLLMAALGWMLISAVSLVGWYLATRLFKQYAAGVMTGVGGLAGIVAVLIGKSGKTGSGHDGGDGKTAPEKDKGARMRGMALGLAAPTFCVAIFVLLARAYTSLGQGMAERMGGGDTAAPMAVAQFVSGADLLFFALPIGVLIVIAWGAGKIVNVNRFSLHGLYRNRLVRAYLGASNPRREPDPFTGFAQSDNLAMHELWRAAKGPADIDCRRPLLVVNTTLNLVRGSRLGWQERKAESFSISPLHCGNFYEGYRRASEYGGRNGITLGTALTISGAAANPNMGYHSSAPVTFLLGILNARLGAWLGNTNARGKDTFTRQGPRTAIGPLFAELLGLTSSKKDYIQLSDGGHFDNLGLYEMVLRRCRFIVVSDAGRDPGYGFDDLGNAIRKIRIDFGVSVDFDQPIGIGLTGDKAMLCAIGTIRYSGVDGGDPANDGRLIYLKPTVSVGATAAPIPYDISSYQKMGTGFPHESTLDQWFDESQFESYRALGLYLVERIAGSLRPANGKRPTATLKDLEAQVKRSLQLEQSAKGPAMAGTGAIDGALIDSMHTPTEHV